jgi:hypothetical protein
MVIQPSHGHNGGVADTLDEAKAAFRAARPSTVRPAESWSSPASAFFRKSGREMLNLSLSAHDPSLR